MPISYNEIYVGDGTSDGTWKITKAGDDLVIERKEASVYVIKSTVTK